MHVPDAIAVGRDRRERIAAGEHQMTGVEAQAQQRGIGAREQRVDFARRFDVAAAVMMEHRAQPGRIADRRGDAFRASREVVPLGGAQAIFVADPPRAHRAVRDAPVVVGEHQQRITDRTRVTHLTRAARVTQQPGRPDRSRHPLVDRVLRA